MASKTCLVIVVVLLVGINVSQADDDDYCNMKNCQPNTHTLCKYSIDDWSDQCNVEYRELSVLSEEDKQHIVNVHNDYRRKIAKGEETRGSPGPQPPASNMRKMIWDDELAKIAQTHAQQCVFEHDECRNVKRKEFSLVGQSIHIGGGLVTYWESTVGAWYDELEYMNSSSVEKLPAPQLNEHGKEVSEVVGHYVNLVYFDTYLVGCAVTFYENDKDKKINKFTVCNYGPFGNWPGWPVYKIGEAGTECPEGTFNDDGLCAIE